MNIEERLAQERAWEAASSRRLNAYGEAYEALEQANRAWEDAARDYRDAYHRVADRNPVLDEFGLPTGEVGPLGRRDTALLASCERLEVEAFARRQTAAAAFEKADAATGAAAEWWSG